ncbi:MAG TPA: hypothetical protein QGG47_15640 [Acidobacteriota bacterium]|nr:hypothetical protein [Acidobacteriota bacterium]
MITEPRADPLRSVPRAVPQHAQVGDLRLTQAFVNALSGAYTGMWVFERSLCRLEPDVDRADELGQAEHSLRYIQAWERKALRGETLFELSERPLLSDDASRAWRLLHVAEGRVRSLIGELIQSSDLKVLADDRFARSVRVASHCEAAYASEVCVLGMLRWTEVHAPLEAGRWRHRLLTCRRHVEEADALLDRFADREIEPDDRDLARLLDSSLLLPADLAERVVEICHVFSLYTGVFEYADVGIPEAQNSVWETAGFGPYAAGRWFAAGLSARHAIDWMDVGAEDPLVAAGFMWRGFTPQEAQPWLSAYIGGRIAASWASAGSDPQEAREWIALGVRDPAAVAQWNDTSRLM